MKTANISYTKNHLSKLLGQVARGESILILDRRVPVARLEPVTAQAADAWVADLEQRGVLSRPRRRPDARVLSGRTLPRPAKSADVVAVLLAEREEGR